MGPQEKQAGGKANALAKQRDPEAGAGERQLGEGLARAVRLNFAPQDCPRTRSGRGIGRGRAREILPAGTTVKQEHESRGVPEGQDKWRDKGA